MTNSLSFILLVAPLIVALWCAVMAALNRPINLIELGALAVLELVLVVQLVFGVAAMVSGGRPVGGVVVFCCYLVGSLLILPVAAVWGLVERTRWGSVVAVVGCLVIPILVVRMQQVWTGSFG